MSFSFFKKSAPEPDPAADLYEMLFCDRPEVYQQSLNDPSGSSPLSQMFSENADAELLKRLFSDRTLETRVRLLAVRKLQAMGLSPEKKELMGVVVEVGMEEGVDVLAAYSDGTVRYINYTGKILIRDARDATSDDIINRLFEESAKIVGQIGPWDKDRLPKPGSGKVRISFLVSDGLYFGEGPIQVLFNDPLAQPALDAATRLLQYVTK